MSVAGEAAAAAAAAAGASYAVGALVWVRRRNGSWWPGRVMNPADAPPPTAIDSKNGTPVKLLGREDASVEWFNLERSIRVKPFRCGEFDACIERVEASEDIPVKRREKYARREDAILHALEIERKQYKAGVITKKREKKNSSVNHSKKPVTADCSKFGMHKSPLLSKRALASVEEDNGVEEDILETIPRTRGLQDFGLRIAPPKKKHIEFVAWDRLQKPVDNHADDVSCSGQNNGGALSAAKRKNFSSHKRKTCMPDGSPAKRRDRRRPLHRVLESSDKLQSFRSFQSDHGVSVPPLQGEKDPMGTICRAKRSRCIYLPVNSNDLSDHAGFSLKHMSTTHATVGSSQHYCGSLADENTSPLSEAVESESFERDYSESNMDEENNLLRENAGTHGRYNDSLELRHTSSEVGVSKWHLKGKRNVRNIGKSCTKVMDGAVSNIVDKCNNSMDGTSYESRGIELNMRIADTSNKVLGHGTFLKKELNTGDGGGFVDNTCDGGNKVLGHDIYPKKELNNGDGGVFVDNTCDGGGVFIDNNCDGGGVLVENDAHTQPIELGNQTHPSALRTANGCDSILEDSDDDSHAMLQADWEVDRPCHADKRAYWEEPEWSIPNDADYLSDEMDATLVDVDLEVRASYQGEHVPLVSLMSRLNGKAIIGHPVQVEILDDGSSDQFFYPYEYSLDESTVRSPFWRTARTTASQRDPRPNLASSALEGDDLEHLQGYYLESKPPLKKVYASHFSHQARLAKKSISHARRSASGKSQRKLIRSVSLSGQKIRTLSSLSTEQKCRIENDQGRGDILNGLIKSKGRGPLVTCVPAKVVFSRIVEAVGRPASSVPRVSSPTKDPS